MRGFLLAFLVLVAATAAGAAEPTFPSLTGRVVDEAGLLSEGQKARLDGMLRAHEQRTTNQVVVVTLRSLQGFPIEDFGYRLGRHWGIGRKEKNNGALLVVAPEERKVRIEVGYGLEGVLTDALSKTIIETAIVPRFKAGDMPGGIVAGTEAVLSALEGKPFAPPDQPAVGAERVDPAKTAVDAAFLLVVVLIVVLSVFGWGRRGRRSGYLGGLYPGGFGGGSGGGGFSGGGGGFGGGGASGGW